MADTDKHFAGSIPEIYDRFLVPLIFEANADDLAEEVAAEPVVSVLETAAGTGAVTRALARRLPAEARITATDLNQQMLDWAAANLSDPRVSWRQADASALPFPDGSFEAVVCQFGVMFFPDKPKAYREAKRVLTPEGNFFFSVWGRIEDNEFAHEVTEALARMFPADPPRFLARTPHGFHDIGVTRAALLDAGFSLVDCETVVRKSVGTAWDAAFAYCQGTPLRTEIEARGPGRLEEATRAASQVLEKRFGQGQIEGKIVAHVFKAAS